MVSGCCCQAFVAVVVVLAFCAQADPPNPCWTCLSSNQG